MIPVDDNIIIIYFERDDVTITARYGPPVAGLKFHLDR